MNKPHFKRKFMKVSRVASVILIGQLSIFSIANALEVSINGSDDLLLATDITYNYQTTPSTISFQVDAPFVCTSINTSAEPIVLGVNDANNIPVTILDGGILSTVYDLSNGKISLVTDDSVKCASENGLHREIFMRTGFENAENDLQITLLDGNGFPFPGMAEVSDQQNIDYQYLIENNGNVPLAANIVEFFKLLSCIG